MIEKLKMKSSYFIELLFAKFRLKPLRIELLPRSLKVLKWRFWTERERERERMESFLF